MDKMDLYGVLALALVACLVLGVRVVILSASLQAWKARLEWDRGRHREVFEQQKFREVDLTMELNRVHQERADLLESRERLVKQVVSMQKLGFTHVPMDAESEEPYAMTNEYELEVEKERQAREQG